MRDKDDVSMSLAVTNVPNAARRSFIKTSLTATGGLIIGFSLPTLIPQADAAAIDSPQAFAPDAFIRIEQNDRIVFVMPRVEMGQGTYTSMTLLIAEELEVPIDHLVLEHAPADDKRYANPMLGFQVTGGSTSVRSAWEPLRRAGATARTILVAAAAQVWNVDPDACHAENGHVLHAPTGRRLRYGELIARAAAIPVPKNVPLKDPKTYKLIGSAVHRLDAPDKVNGRAKYGLDASVPGMKIAAVAACPVRGGRLGAVDETAARAVAGVRQIVRIENAVAVVADHTGAARKGLAALKITWDEGPNAAYSTEQMIAELAQMSLNTGAVARREGDFAASASSATGTVDVIYQQPFLAHACMEPMNCTVHVRHDACELWLGTQVPARAQSAAAEITGIPVERVQVHNHLLGGGFGRRLDVDYVTQAVKIAKQVSMPLKVFWSREEDTQQGTYRPYHYNRLTAALDRDGKPVGWHHRVTASSILARWLPSRFKEELDGDAIRDAAGPYGFPNILVEYVRKEPAQGIVTGFWRGVGHMQNAFPVECFMDELAHRAGTDPIAYRAALLAKHPRALKVLELAAEKSGWNTPLPAGDGRGRGIAMTFCFGTYAALVTEVNVDKDGNIKPERMVVVVDCGRIISHDTIKAQMQGGAVFGLSAVLFGNISIKDGRVEQGNFDSYRVLRLDETPAIETYLIESAEEPGGIGEVSTVMVAPSVLNAVFAASGKRIRKLPYDPDELKHA